MDPIDHSYALARLEEEYDRETKFYEKKVHEFVRQQEELQEHVLEMVKKRDDARMKLVSIRSLQATILPSAVLQ